MHPLRPLIRLVETAMTEDVWHGTAHPDPIEQFSTAFTGGGSGYQTYGWGLYFANSREIADHYRVAAIAKNAEAEMEAKFGWGGEMVATITRESGIGRARELYGNDNRPGFKEALAYMEDRLRSQPGRMYQVTIPDEGAYLLWNKRLSEQPPKVQSAIKRLPKKLTSLNGTGDLMGMIFYRNLTKALGGSQKDASLALLAKGIVGIKYFDEVDPDTGAGDYNYVVFDGGKTAVKSME